MKAEEPRRRRRGVWRHLLQPVAGMLQAVLGHLHVWVVLMILLYAASGITVVGPDEIALVKRFGRFVSAGGVPTIHDPGLLFALPSPIDDVVRVNVKRVYETELTTLMAGSGAATHATLVTIDPTQNGYALTGDHNIVHARFTVHYRVGDPVAFLIGTGTPERLLVDVVTGEAVRTIGERSVDQVLAEGRAEFVGVLRDRAQARLEAGGSGLTIVSLELTVLAPPGPVTAAFTAVQSAVIGAQTQLQNARTERASALPASQSRAAERLSAATKYAVTARADAAADATAFRALAAEDRRTPSAVRERLYRDAVARVLANAGTRDLLPPPIRDRYRGLRITIPTRMPRRNVVTEP